MIRPLRTCHRNGFLALAVLLPAVLAVGLRGRRKPVLVPAQDSSAGFTVVSEETGHWRNYPISVRKISRGTTQSGMWLQLLPQKEIVVPDVLVYWSADPPAGALPANALLLGSFDASASYSVPSGGATGYLILYSAAERNVLDATALGGQP
jgi:hypothetical protein